MERLVDFFELFVRHVGIDLSRGDGRMAEHFLHGADVGAVGNEVGRKRMAQSVGMDVLHNAGLGCIVFHDSLDRAGSEAQVVSVLFFLQTFDTDPRENGRVDVRSFVEISLKRVFCPIRNENYPDFSAFSAHAEFLRFEIHLIAVEIGEL